MDRAGLESRPQRPLAVVSISAPAASLLSLPCEIRNTIYSYIFDADLATLPVRRIPEPDSPLAVALQISIKRANDECYHDDSNDDNRQSAIRRLSMLQTCKQIRNEAHLLALSCTAFHIHGECSYPELFAQRVACLSPIQVSAIRTITLTARISHLRALNEAWAGQPFGHDGLQLDALIIVPSRPDVTTAPFREIADLSQSHALAHVLCETLKGLRNVRRLEVRNGGCFDEDIWRKFYVSLVYRLWRWGGSRCGIRFESGLSAALGSAQEENRWFRAHLRDVHCGVEVGDEVCKLVGWTGEFPVDPAEGL